MSYLLLCEYEFIQDHLATLHQKRKEATQEMADALEQSGDGWHDNAAFQAPKESAKNLSVQIEDYSNLLKKAIIVNKEARTPIGKKFVIEENGTPKTYLITGMSLDRDAYKSVLEEGHTPISHTSPLGLFISELRKDIPTKFRERTLILKEIIF